MPFGFCTPEFSCFSQVCSSVIHANACHTHLFKQTTCRALSDVHQVEISSLIEINDNDKHFERDGKESSLLFVIQSTINCGPVVQGKYENKLTIFVQMQTKSLCLHSSFRNAVTSCAYLHCEFQVAPMNSWGISFSFRCGFLLNSQFHYKSICIKTRVHISSLPHYRRERGISKAAEQLRFTPQGRKPNKPNKNKTHLLYSLSFSGISLCCIQGGTRPFCSLLVLLSARDLISLLCVTVWSTGPGSNWPRVM